MWVKSESFIKNRIKRFLGNLRLFFDYLRTTPVKEVLDKKDDVENSILKYYSMKIIDVVFVNVFAGLAINFTLYALFDKKFSLLSVVAFGVLYWFLIRFLRIVVLKER